MEIVFDHSEAVAQNITTFWFRAEQKPDYAAGQYIELYLPHANADSRGQKRWFTLSSSPSETLLAVTTKTAKSGSSSFKNNLLGLRPGDTAVISQPMGDFVLPKDSALPLLFLAAGVGITPVRSIVKWLSDQHQQRDLHVVYGLRDVSELAYKDLITGYTTNFNTIISSEAIAQNQRPGRIDAKLLKKLVPDYISRLVYISGPERFVETLSKDLRMAGIPGGQLVLDFYHGYGSI